MAQFGIISADSHVVEPVETFSQYLDPKFKDRAPRVESRSDHDVLLVDGLPPRHLGGQAVAGRDPKLMRVQGRYKEGSTQGGWDPHVRIKDMDLDHVDAEVIYPTIAFFVWRVPDPAYRVALMDSYNRWLADYCKTAPDRIIGLGLIAIHDTNVALRQIRDVSKLGLRGICIPSNAPKDKPFTHKDYEPIWAAVQDTKLPISLHVFTGAEAPPEITNFLIRYTVIPSYISETITTFISGGIFERYPNLKLVSVEVDVGWMANYLQRIDHAYERHRYRTGLGDVLKEMPSYYFKRQVFGTFMDDRAGVVMRNEIGIKNIMWSSDYPHSDSTWPHSQEVIKRIFAGIPEPDKRRILLDNVKELYSLN